MTLHMLITGIHLTICVVLILIVLLQQGKGADMGAAFGGGSNTLFGASGADNLLTRITTGLAFCFMLTSIYLASKADFDGRSSGGLLERLEQQTTPSAVEEPAPATTTPAPADSAPPAAQAPGTEPSSPPPPAVSTAPAGDASNAVPPGDAGAPPAPATP